MARGVLCNESWLPDVLKSKLTADRAERPTSDVHNWLTDLRHTVEEYEESVNQCPSSKISASLTSLQSIDSASFDHFNLNKYLSAEEDSLSEISSIGANNAIDGGDIFANAFDSILSSLGNEIFKLDTYQRKYSQGSRSRLSSELEKDVMYLFDDCMDELSREAPKNTIKSNGIPAQSFGAKMELNFPALKKVNSFSNISTLSDEVFVKSTAVCDSKDSEITIRSNTNGQSKKHCSLDVNHIFDNGDGAPVAPKRKNRHSNPCEHNENFNISKPRPVSKLEQLHMDLDKSADGIKTSKGRIVNVYAINRSDSDSGNASPSSDHSDYQNLWHCTSGSRKSDKKQSTPIFQENFGLINTISFDSVRDISNSTLDISKQRIVVCGRHAPSAKSSSSGSDSVKSEGAASNNNDLRVPVDDWHNRSRRSCVENDSTSRYSYNERGKMVRLSDGDLIQCTSECDLSDDCHRSLDRGGKKSNSFVYKTGRDQDHIYENVYFLKATHRTEPSRRPLSDMNAKSGGRDRTEAIPNNSNSSSFMDDELNSSSIEIVSDSDSWRTPMGRGRTTSSSTEYVSESPIYENLQDLRVKSVPPDVQAWKALLLDPYWNDDEEDEWVTPEKVEEYSKEQKPPYVIPRINSSKIKPLNLTQQKNVPKGPMSPSFDNTRKMFERMDNNNRTQIDFTHKVSKIPSKNTGSNEFLSHSKYGYNEASPIVMRKHLGDIPRMNKSKSMITCERNDHSKNSNKVKVLPYEFSPTPPPLSNILTGNIQRAKLTENGKKVRKNWHNNYAVLDQLCLTFYKDKSSKDKNVCEAKVLLQGALVSQSTPQQTSRTQAIVISTKTRSQHLIYHEDSNIIQQWFDLIAKTINSHTNDYSCPDDLKLSNIPNGTPSPTQKHPKHKIPTKVPEGSMEDLTNLPETTKIQSKLMKFLKRRPTMESLIKEGIYKDEPVFGRCLEQASFDSVAYVPEFVVRCIKAIESTTENMCSDGLYRASANISQVQKIRLEVDQNNLLTLDTESDVHVLAGALKLYFRELKEPLIPFRLFQKSLDASCIQKEDVRIKEFKEIIKNLPECNSHTLKYLLEHLLRVTSYKEQNRMHISNIAIIMGPTLLIAPPESAQNMAIDCLKQNRVIEILMSDFDKIFKDDEKKKK